MHSKIILLLLIATTTVCHGGTESGEIYETTGTLTLRQALALALTRSPELAAVGYDIRIAEAKILQAKLLPNPALDLEAEDIAGSGSFANGKRSQTTLQLGQLIELGGKRRTRVGEARLSRDLAAFDYETKKREVFVKTAGSFVDVLAGQRRVKVAEELVSLATSFIPAVVKRVEAGKASDLEKTRFDVAIGSARIELEQSKRDLLAARQRLALQWGSSNPRFGAVVGDLDAAPLVASLQDLARRVEANPRLARFGTEVAHREAALAREKAAAQPDITLRAGGRWIAESDDTTAVLGFSLPLPLWNGNQGNIRAARAQLERTGAEHSAVAASLMAELSDAYNNLVRARTTISILRETVLPGAESAVSATGEGYEAGRFSFLEVVDARRTLGAARIQLLDAVADYHKALHQIEALTAQPVPHNLP
jgi:cobalt-zinc-cadmium efflux system outer membrane protein